jgi:hypothetical protein
MRYVAVRAVVALAVAVAMGGCGGSVRSVGPSVSVYCAKVTAACQADAGAIRRLPQLQRVEHLTVVQLERRAVLIGDRFKSAIDSVDPPSSLRTAHEELLALVRKPAPSTTTRAAAIASLKRTRAVYQRLGVSGCVKLSNEALARLGPA